jgi:hypothetical protein
MANLMSKSLKFKLDNATAALTDISAYVNTASLQGVQDALEDTGFGLEERTYGYGLASATIPINGFINSTTEAIVGPLIGNRTSVLKTFQFYDGSKYKFGEALVTAPQISGNVGQLQTFSLSLQLTGAITRTSTSVIA